MPRLAAISFLQTIILKVPGTEGMARVCSEQCRQRGQYGRQALVSIGPTGEQPSAVPLAVTYGRDLWFLHFSGHRDPPQTPAKSPSSMPASISNVPPLRDCPSPSEMTLILFSCHRQEAATETHTAISSFSLSARLDFSILAAFSRQLGCGLNPLGASEGVPVPPASLPLDASRTSKAPRPTLIISLPSRLS